MAAMKVLLPGAAVAAVLLGGCGARSVPTADELLPAATAADWRTYADHLVLAEVTSAQKQPMTQEEIVAGEGFEDRVLTFRIDRILWSRDGVRAAPADLTISIDGWTVGDGKETPMRFAGEPEIRVGHAYVLPITYLDAGRLVGTPGWSNLSATAIVPADDGEMGQGDEIVGHPSEVMSALLGKPISAAAELMWRTSLPEAARPYMGLPPTDRFRAVSRAQRTSAPD